MISSPTAPNPNKLMAQLRMMPDQQLVQYAQMHKNDPYIFPMAFQESNTRKQMRAAQNSQAAPAPKVVDQNLQQMAQAMLEEQGIAMLPAPNMQNMAGGGIVAFEEGGDVPGYAGGGTPGDEVFELAFKKVLKFEGGSKYLKDDAGKGPTKYGINQTANPDVDIKNLTEDQAKDIYRKRYWNAIGGDALAMKNPQLATIAFDAAVNQGPGTAKQMLAQADDNPYELLKLRQQRYVDLKNQNPEKFGKFLGGWTDRVSSLQKDLEKDRSNRGLPALTPGAQAMAASPPKVAPQAQDTTALMSDDNFTDPMTGFSLTQASVGKKPKVLSKEGARQTMLGFGDLPYAIAGATSDIGNAALRGLTLGRYNEPEPTLGSAHLKRLAIDYLGREAESADPAMRNMRTAGEITGTFINPVTGLRTAATKTEAGLNALFGAQKAKEAAAVSTPAKMPLRLTAEQPAIPVTPAGEAAAAVVVGSGGRSLQETQKALEAERLANQARDQLDANQLAKQAARYAEPNPPLAETAKVASPGEKTVRAIQIAGETAAVTPKTFPFAFEDTTSLRPSADIGESVFDPTFGGKMPLVEDKAKVELPSAGIKDLAKAETTGGMDMNKLLLQMGLQLMAGKSPNLMTNIGEAGLGVLGMQQAEAKALSERESRMSEAEYRKTMGKYYDANTASIERGAKEKNLNLEAEKLIAQRLKELPKLTQVQLATDPTRAAAVEANIRKEIYRQLGIEPTMSTNAPIGGAKFLGFENPA